VVALTVKVVHGGKAAGVKEDNGGDIYEFAGTGRLGDGRSAYREGEGGTPAGRRGSRGLLQRENAVATTLPRARAKKALSHNEWYTAQSIMYSGAATAQYLKARYLSEAEVEEIPESKREPHLNRVA
jgi:hypothetical protein